MGSEFLTPGTYRNNRGNKHRARTGLHLNANPQGRGRRVLRFRRMGAAQSPLLQAAPTPLLLGRGQTPGGGTEYQCSPAGLLPRKPVHEAFPPAPGRQAG